MNSQLHISDAAVYLPAPSGTTKCLVVFFPGNPGLIEYYHDFLEGLFAQICDSETVPISASTEVAIFGMSLANFSSKPDSTEPYGLRAQIEYVERKLHRHVQQMLETGKWSGPLKVILVGHSVGAFIGMEVLRRWSEQKWENLEHATRFGSNAATNQLKIIGYIGLWPTITWIARSPRGRKLAVRRSPQVFVY